MARACTEAGLTPTAKRRAVAFRAQDLLADQRLSRYSAEVADMAQAVAGSAPIADKPEAARVATHMDGGQTLFANTWTRRNQR